MKYTVISQEFSFEVIISVLTGRPFATLELQQFALFLSGESSIGQILAERESKWIPWLLVQFPWLSKIDLGSITDDNACKWLEEVKRHYGQGVYTVRSVHHDF